MRQVSAACSEVKRRVRPAFIGVLRFVMIGVDRKVVRNMTDMACPRIVL